jgi:4-alpha-glucanotransferase
MGEIGPEAYAFADALVDMGQHIWQVLPLGPTGYGDSPYQSLSTFAGNPLLISFDLLVEDELLTPSRLRGFSRFPVSEVDFGPVIEARQDVLDSVCRSFQRRASEPIRTAFAEYCERNREWLDDYALYVALKAACQGRPWTDWPAPLRDRESKAVAEARKVHRTAIRNVNIRQFLFDDHWRRLVDHCHRREIRVVGDIPIFVAHDSADVWANRDLFFIGADGQPTVIAGVPPDYFSATGQRWGNPLYDWSVHESTGYAWWIARMRKVFELVDVVRIDHFRGFDAYWEIPGDEPTAINGRWVAGPGEQIFFALREALSDLPIIAEDLGVITPEVEALRDQFEFPGMKVLQFTFQADPGDLSAIPNHFPPNSVCYTGTHDNDTTRGWFWGGTSTTLSEEEADAERARVLEFVGTDGTEIEWDLIEVAFRCPSRTAICPLQDVLGLDSSGRMNVPGQPGGNWRWRFSWDQLTLKAKQRMAGLAARHGRVHRCPA